MELQVKPDFERINIILTKALVRNQQGADLKNGDFQPEELEEVALQVLLLQHGGYIEADYEPRLSSSGPANFAIKGLTFEGHSLLKLLQDEAMWQQTLQLIREKGLETDFETVKIAVAAIINGMLS